MKQFILKLATIIMIIVAFMGCTKFAKNVTVKGRVLNPITNEPISGAKIGLIKNGNPLEWEGGYKAIKSTTSNENGEFEISAGRLGPVWVVASYGDYQTIYNLGWDYKGKYYSMLKVDKGKTMYVDYHLVTYGEIHWHIKNMNCEGSNDSMWFKTKYQYKDDFIESWNYAIPYVGCVDFNGNGTDKIQMGNHIIYMKIKRPSGIIYKYDTVFVNKDGVTYFDLYY